MREFSKFRVITVGFILMFIFVIAAMYTNTKDIAKQKALNKSNYENKIDNDASSQNFNRITFDDSNNEDLEHKFNDMQNRIEILEETVNNFAIKTQNSPSLNCQIRGVLDNGDVIPLDAKESLDEAKLNKKEIVITCTLQ